jgi:hypothetical protein
MSVIRRFTAETSPTTLNHQDGLPVQSSGSIEKKATVVFVVDNKIIQGDPGGWEEEG